MKNRIIQGDLNILMSGVADKKIKLTTSDFIKLSKYELELIK